DNGHYVISRTIRERIIYAPQDVLRDPPFTRLDLVSCRNLLIYLQPALQRQLLPLFHYALRPDGLLFLGASESVGAVEGLFTPVDARWKIFRRDPGARAVPTLPARQGPARPDPGTQEAGWGGPGNVVQSADKLLLDLFAPSCVLVTQRGEITYVRGRTGAWLEPSEGQPALNVLNMAREGLGPELAVALQRAANEQTTITRPRVRVKTNSEWSRVDVTVRPVAGRTLRGLYLITVTPVPEAEPAPVAGSGTAVGAGDGDAEAPHPLEQELQLTRENLQSTVEELEASNEELKSTNEELQSTNEELQSANEELETSKEELQSLNEELQTVNSELEQKMAEASQISDDMTNLLHSIDIATVFLDRNLRIKRFTPPARTLIRLIDSDVGRPIDDLASRLEYDELVDDAREVLATLVPRQREVMGTAGDWFQVRVRPYRTSDDRLDGVVITFVDVTGTRQAHAVVENLIETAHEPLAVLDDELRILGANAAFLELFGLATTEVRGLPLQAFRIQSPQAGDLAQVLDAIPADRTLENREIRHIYPDGTTRTLHLSARRLEPKRALAGRFIVAFQPVSDRPDQNPE
ncbi:MAG: PAS domain-containing protein, partial [Planctomycetota bacterium]